MKEPFKIPSFSVIIIFICLMLIGVALMPLLPYRSRASAELPNITVRFNTKSQLPPRIVEQEITNKLEQALCRTENVVSINSISSTNSGEVTLEFSPDTNLEEAKFNVSINIRKIWDQISEVSFYPNVYAIKAERGGGTLLQYHLTANQPVGELIKYTEREIVPQLSLVKGVKSVGYPKADNSVYVLKYDAKMLENLLVEPESITETINSANVGAMMGMVPYHTPSGEKNMLRLNVCNNMTIDDIMHLTVTLGNGKKFPLASLIEIVPADETFHSDFRINGQNSVWIDVSAKDNANEMAVSRKVRQRMNEIAQHLPEGYSISLGTDNSSKVESEVRNIVVRSIMTLLILVVFMFLSMRNKKVVFATIFSLFASLSVSVIGYYLFDVEMNLYAMAGVTISLSIMIDNLIVMSSQLLRKQSITVFQPMLAATVTTIAALSIVFFLDYAQKVTLKDFAVVIIINLTASLLTATFLVPALMAKLNVAGSGYMAGHRVRHRLLQQAFNRIYEKTIEFLIHHRALALAMLILAFGLPVYMLPMDINGEGYWTELYNKTLGSRYYNKNLREHVNTFLGGSLYQLHKTRISKFSDTGNPFDAPSISISAELPPGGSSDMINVPIRKMEDLIAALPGISHFETTIQSPQAASINVYFDNNQAGRKSALSAREQIVNRALEVSGVSWKAGGPGDLQFANTVFRSAGKDVFRLRGYNYDELSRYAGMLRDSLETVKRVRNISVATHLLPSISDYAEFDLKISNEALSGYGLTLWEIYNAVAEQYGGSTTIRIDNNGNPHDLTMQTRHSTTQDQWDFMNRPIEIRGVNVKLSDIAELKKHVSPMDIYKTNQEYEFVVQYDYKGSYTNHSNLIEKQVESFSNILPMGFSIQPFKRYEFIPDKELSPLLILVIIAIIFVTTCILLNSFKQPFAIILVIPVSFIGMFHIFSYLGIPLGIGGMGALVLLCGQTVNASIYLTYEYNLIRKQYPSLKPAKAFVRSWNHKASPIFLTILSTVIGFIPFIVGTNIENKFWFELAVGTIAGLSTSLIGVFVFLPAFLVSRKRNKIKRPVLPQEPSELS